MCLRPAPCPDRRRRSIHQPVHPQLLPQRAAVDAEYACRLLNHLRDTGMRQCEPLMPQQDVTGRDWILENEADVEVIDDLVYSKATSKPARWVLVVKDGSPFKKIEDLQGKKIYTELVNFTKKYFSERTATPELDWVM